MYPKHVAKEFCGEWWVFIYFNEDFSALNEKCESQIDAELKSAQKNVELYTEMKNKENQK